MAKDPIIESHIAQSRAKIDKMAPETIETERHIDKTKLALERSRQLLTGSPGFFGLPPPASEAIAMGAAADRRLEPPKKPAARKPKPKRPR